MATQTTELAGMYELDRTHSTLHFAVRHAGVSTFRGSFSEIDAHLVIDERGPTLTADVLVASISIVDPPEFREHVVRGADFFAANAHPRMTFQSTRIELGPGGKISAAGVLDIRGVKGHVSGVGEFTPPTEDPFGNTRIGLSLRGTVDRRGWGMDWQMQLPSGGDALGWDVEISAQLEFAKSN